MAVRRAGGFAFQRGCKVEDRQDGEELESQGAGERGRSKAVLFTIIAVVLIVVIGAGIWWGAATFGRDTERGVIGAVDGYFTAAARNDREAATNYIYMGEDAGELGGDDFSAPFDAETFFAYRAVQVRHYFAGDNDAYVFGWIEYNERPSREFTAVLRRGDRGWGLLRLSLSDPLEEPEPASVLVGERDSGLSPLLVSSD